MSRLLLVLLAASVSAQSGLLAALNQAGLTTFASALSAGSVSSALSAIDPGSNASGTLFCPSNAALANASPSNAQLLYHLVEGSFPASSIPSSGDTIVRTYLPTGTAGTSLPGSESQVLTLGKLSNGTVQVRQGLSNATVTATTTYQSVVIYTIDSVLSLPANLSTTATAAGLNSLAITLQQVLPGAIETFEAVQGITVFAPVNAGINLPALLSSIPSGTVGNVLGNHLLNGSVVYTPSMLNGSEVVSSSGGVLSFSTNSSGIFISAKQSTVQVLIPDVPIENGVVHVVSGVLVDPNANAALAAKAYSSAQANAPTGMQTAAVSQSLPTTIATS